MPAAGFFSLSPELHIIIISHLDIRSICNISLASRYFCELTQILVNPKRLPSPWRWRLYYCERILKEVRHGPRFTGYWESFLSSTLALFGLLDSNEQELAWGGNQQEAVRVYYPMLLDSRAKNALLPEIRVTDIFITLDYFFGLYTEEQTNSKPTHAKLKLRMLRQINLALLVQVLEKRYLPLGMVQRFFARSLTPAEDDDSILAKTSSVYKLITAYLFITGILPSDVLNVLYLSLDPALSYVEKEACFVNVRTAVLEFFELLLLFLKVYRYGSETANSPGQPVVSLLSSQTIKILIYRLEEWVGRYFAEPKPLLPSFDEEPRLTPEQQMVVQYNVRRGDLLKVQAYAGTGKTKCLIAYAASRPRQKFLYAAFNTSIAQASARIFPRNVECRTVHSLAYRAIELYAPQLYGKDCGMPSATEIIELLELTPADACKILRSQDGAKRLKMIANKIKRIIEKFSQTRDLQVCHKHLPRTSTQCETYNIDEDLLIRYAQNLWELIRNGQSHHMPHDAYLKLLYEAGNDDLAARAANGRLWADEVIFGGYDAILFDEAQDATGVMASILLRQREYMGCVLVGDAYQKIYGFKGATGICFNEDVYPATRTLYLTHTFRFGDSIAAAANTFLKILGEERLIIGGRIDDKVMRTIEGKPPFGYKHILEQPYTVLCRKNRTLLNKLLELCLQRPNVRICFKTSSSFSGVGILGLLQEAHALFHYGVRPKSWVLRPYSTWHDLEEYYIREVKDIEDLSASDKTIEHIFSLFERIRAKPPETFLEVLSVAEKSIVEEEEDADIILTTVHQAKGLEWDRVAVADDFPPKLSQDWLYDAHRITFQNDEYNILYVALTRARKELILPRRIVEFLAYERGLMRPYLENVTEPMSLVKQGVHYVESLNNANAVEIEPALEAVLQRIERNGVVCEHDLANGVPGVMVKVDYTLPFGSFDYARIRYVNKSVYYPFLLCDENLYCYSCVENAIERDEADLLLLTNDVLDVEHRFLRIVGNEALSADSYKATMSVERVRRKARRYYCRIPLNRQMPSIIMTEAARVIDEVGLLHRTRVTTGMAEIDNLLLEFGVEDAEYGLEEEEWGIEEEAWLAGIEDAEMIWG